MEKTNELVDVQVKSYMINMKSYYDVVGRISGLCAGIEDGASLYNALQIYFVRFIKLNGKQCWKL